MTGLCFHNLDDLFENKGMLTLTLVFCSSFTLLRKEKEYHSCATRSTQCSAITNSFTVRVLRHKSKGRRRQGKLSKKEMKIM
jgi:hypothetical protein